MSERLTDDDVRHVIEILDKTDRWAFQDQTYSLAKELLVLRAQAKELVLEIGVRDGMINDLQARVAKLEEERDDLRESATEWGRVAEFWMTKHDALRARIACEGFTRPQCEPCLNEDVRVVRVATVDGDEDKRLCEVCIARLLPPPSRGGWA